ncbi:heterocyst differentiation related protein [Nostoc sp. UHCC 0870]|uniref:heterocyst differentiation related protein n=1 Tax=Nostoc sp. UHCC 0870 TaxID=2914041 RepID=UPI001EDF1DE8|nr:heterocyst differentiation related protein [Nostoc sp. UHCC 0870]UKO97563.1 heterocyst differentiation related protein [Nostoc sp. UHCC 0870]
MSESMAFIGGVAVAGLAALLLLRGTNASQANFAVSPQMPGALVAPQPIQPPTYYPPYGQAQYPNQPPVAPSTEQRVELERLKMDFERLKSDNEQLRAQNQQLQFQFQNYNNQQLQQAQQNSQRVATAAFQAESPWWSSPIVWAAGGATLTIGGGVVVAGVLSLFTPRARPTRTVQVIHPYQGATQPLVPVRRAEFLPPGGMDARRVEAHEYDEMI